MMKRPLTIIKEFYKKRGAYVSTRNDGGQQYSIKLKEKNRVFWINLDAKKKRAYKRANAEPTERMLLTNEELKMFDEAGLDIWYSEYHADVKQNVTDWFDFE